MRFTVGAWPARIPQSAIEEHRNEPADKERAAEYEAGPYKGYGKKIQEAFAASRPVVASRLGGMAEFVTHGVNGLLFEAGDPAALAAALADLLAQPELLAHLRGGIPAVRTTGQELEALSGLYAGLAGGTPTEPPALPHAGTGAPW